MNKTLVTTLFISYFAALGCANDLQSDQIFVPDEEMIPEDHVVVDSRPLSSVKKKLMQEKRLQEAQQSEEVAEEHQTVDLSAGGLIIPIKTHNLALLASNHVNATAASYSPYLYHWIESFPQSNILKLEDGSEWIFDANKDGYVIRSWRPGDTLVIAPMSWFWGSNYSYVITNKDLGSSISVNPFLGPISFGPLTTWVVGIDHNQSQVYLLNGQGERTVWEVSNTDQYLFNEWAVNDTIIIGENSSWLWWFSSYNHIMINVNMNHHVRARQVSSTPNFRNAVNQHGG